MLFLIAGQIATAAISFVVTAVLARRLGAEDYGVFYLAATLVQSAFVLADLGQGYYVVGKIAQDASGAGALLGTGLVLRLLVGVATYPLLAGLAAVLDYPEVTRHAISLTVIFFLVGSIGDAISVIVRGLERMGLEAGLRVASKLLVGAAIVLGVINDGRLESALVMQIVGAVAVLPIYWLALRRLHLTRFRTSLPTAVAVLSGGAPFLLWAAVVTAQPSLDALLLSKLAPSSVIGWYAAASKLVGLLIFPATLVAAALYPTFSRLYAQRSVKYGKLVQIALRATVVLGALSTVGTYLFADVTVTLIYGPEGFAPASSNLKLLAAYLPLVFVDITLGTAIMAASIQTRWIVAKVVSLAVATGLDVALIPLAQARYGNGGLGCAAATFAAELVMFVAAFVLVPVEKKRLAIGLSNDVGRVVAAALIMAGVAWIVRSAQPLLGMTVAVITYFASIYLLGVIRREDVRLVGDVVRLRAPA